MTTMLGNVPVGIIGTIQNDLIAVAARGGLQHFSTSYLPQQDFQRSTLPGGALSGNINDFFNAFSLNGQQNQAQYTLGAPLGFNLPGFAPLAQSPTNYTQFPNLYSLPGYNNSNFNFAGYPPAQPQKSGGSSKTKWIGGILAGVGGLAAILGRKKIASWFK